MFVVHSMPGAPSIEDFGWDAGWADLFRPYEAEGLRPARVLLEHNHVFRVLTADGERLAESAGRMKFRAEGREALPAVGDWIVLGPGAEGVRAQIRAILPRRTRFSRKAAGRETEEQVIAANVDVVFVVFGLDLGLNLRAIERYLVVARRSGATPVIVLNKIDLAGTPETLKDEAAAAAGETAVEVVSAKTSSGLAGLEAYLTPGRTVAFIGPSGAGKSSLVNRLIGGTRQATGEVRARDSRGRHTSVHRQLILREAGGLVIDTPGMREVQLWDTDAVHDAFDDIAGLAGSCRFRDCRHDREPGCAVKAAVDAGVVAADRYASFLKLQAESDATARKRDERALVGSKQAGRIGQKAMRAFQKARGRR